MAKDKVRIDTKQVKALRSNIASRQRLLIGNMIDAADEVLLNAESDAKALAGRDSGQLENSINSSQATYSNDKISGKVGSNLVYALRRHEEHERMGTYNKYEDGVKYEGYYFNGRGEMTRAKPSIEGFKPGRKYLENAGTLNETNWRNNLTQAVTDTYKGL
ncbi:HK97 gp10 family phage protein [Staphylococcus saprophyticus]|nr:HK97 gp10 family phage protein [Staphylococcus saprophyticus]